jgi:tartrate dehydrogenase/decarboxylase/D-malate dehydrogenase
MMLQHLGEQAAADAVMKAIEHSLSNVKSRTRDLGGRATTEEVGKAIAGAVG